MPSEIKQDLPPKIYFNRFEFDTVKILIQTDGDEKNHEHSWFGSRDKTIEFDGIRTKLVEFDQFDFGKLSHFAIPISLPSA